MEGIIVLRGTVSDVTGYRDGCAVVIISYKEMKYRKLGVKGYELSKFSAPKFVDIPYRGAMRLTNPEIFDFDWQSQPSIDGFGVPVNKLRSEVDVTVYVHWADLPKTDGSVDYEIRDVVIMVDNPLPESLKSMISHVAEKLST